MTPKLSIAEKSLQFTGLFEAELLTHLMLRFWNHPHAEDRDFTLGLLETAAEILRCSIAGNQLIAEVPPQQMSLVAALWLAERISVTEDIEIEPVERDLRIQWMETVRRSIPSCFCDQSLLDDGCE